MSSKNVIRSHYQTSLKAGLTSSVGSVLIAGFIALLLLVIYESDDFFVILMLVPFIIFFFVIFLFVVYYSYCNIFGGGGFSCILTSECLTCNVPMGEKFGDNISISLSSIAKIYVEKASDVVDGRTNDKVLIYTENGKKICLTVNYGNPAVKFAEDIKALDLGIEYERKI